LKLRFDYLDLLKVYPLGVYCEVSGYFYFAIETLYSEGRHYFNDIRGFSGVIIDLCNEDVVTRADLVLDETGRLDRYFFSTAGM
jgi:hypothetical protein